ncbi:hypothetical protein E3P99_02781 [Wallemia hederae]|uniref:PH domain-containing protein n=1 Tax=Wallemia hederae TaxID=1540922 RepID=A0A4T0FIM8_9BASI|nr:hypothetical protein E3P99_02781 [Wallemia hederae]
MSAVDQHDQDLQPEEAAVLEQLWVEKKRYDEMEANTQCSELMSNQSSTQPYIPHVLSVIGEESEPATTSSQSQSNSHSNSNNSNSNNSRSRSSSTNDVFRSFPDFKSIDDVDTLSSPSSREQAPSTKPPSSLQHVPTISSMSSRSSGQPSSIPTIPSQYSTTRQPPALETPAFSSSPFVAFDQPAQSQSQSHSRSNSASDSNSRAGNLIAFFESNKEKVKSREKERERERERDAYGSPPISKVIQTKRPINLNRNKDDDRPQPQSQSQPQRLQAQLQQPIPSLPSPTRLDSLADGWETMISSSGAPTDSSTPLTSHKTPLTSQRPTTPIDLSSFDDITEQIARAGTLWYLHVHDGTPYRWVRARAALLPTTLKLSFLPSPDLASSRLQRQIVTLDLNHCSEVRSIASPSNPASHKMDLGLVAAREQGGLEGVLNPFVLVYQDGWERLATDSARERVQWVGAFWDVIRPIQTPQTRMLHREPSIASSTTSSATSRNSPLLQPGQTTLTGTPIVRRPVSPSHSNAGSVSAFNVRAEDFGAPEPTASDSEQHSNTSMRRSRSSTSKKKRESLDDMSIGMIATTSTSDTVRGLGILSDTRDGSANDSEADDIIFPPSVSVRAHRRGGRRRRSGRSSDSSSSSSTTTTSKSASKKSDSKSFGTSTERMLKSPKLGQLNENDEEDVDAHSSNTHTRSAKSASEKENEKVKEDDEETPSPQQPETATTPRSQQSARSRSHSRTQSARSIQNTPDMGTQTQNTNDLMRSLPASSSSSSQSQSHGDTRDMRDVAENGTSTNELLRSLSRKSSKPSTMQRAESLSSSHKSLSQLADALGDSPEDKELKDALSELISKSKSGTPDQNRTPTEKSVSLSRRSGIKKTGSTASSNRSSVLRNKDRTMSTEYHTAETHSPSSHNVVTSTASQAPLTTHYSTVPSATHTNSSPSAEVPSNNTEANTSEQRMPSSSSKKSSTKAPSRSRSQKSSSKARSDIAPPEQNAGVDAESESGEFDDEDDFDMDLLAPSRTGSPDSMWPPSRVSSLVSKKAPTTVSRSSTIDSKLLAPTVISASSDGTSMQLEKSSDGQTTIMQDVADLDRDFLTSELQKLFNALLARDAGRSNQTDDILNAIQSELGGLAESIRVLPFRRRGSGDISVTTDGKLTSHHSVPDLPAEPNPESFDNRSGDILREVRNKSSMSSMPPPIQPIVQDDKAIHDLENKVNGLIDVCRDALQSKGSEERARDANEERNNKHMLRLENLVRSLIRHFTHGGASSISSWPDMMSEHPFDVEDDADVDVDDGASSSTVTQKPAAEQVQPSADDMYPHDSISMRDVMGPLPTPPVQQSHEISEAEIPHLSRRDRDFTSRRRWARSESPPAKSLSSVSTDTMDDEYDDLLYPDIYQPEAAAAPPLYEGYVEELPRESLQQPMEDKNTPKIAMDEGGYPRTVKDARSHDFKPPQERLARPPPLQPNGMAMPMPGRPPMAGPHMSMPHPMRANYNSFRGGFRPPPNFNGHVRPAMHGLRGFHPPMLPPMMGGAPFRPPLMRPAMGAGPMHGAGPMPMNGSMPMRNAPMFRPSPPMMGSVRGGHTGRFMPGSGPMPPPGVPPGGMGIPLRFGSDFHPGFNETLYNTRRAGWNTEEILRHQMDADRYLGALNNWLEKEVSAKINEWGPVQRQIKEMEEVLRDVRDSVNSSHGLPPAAGRAMAMPEGGDSRGLDPASGGQEPRTMGDAPADPSGESRGMGDAPNDRAVSNADDDDPDLKELVPHFGDDKAKHPSDTMRGMHLNEATGSRLPSEHDDGAELDDDGAKSVGGRSEAKGSEGRGSEGRGSEGRGSESKGPPFTAVRSDKPFAEEIPGLGKFLKGKATSQMPDQVDTSRPPSQFGDVVQPEREKSHAGSIADGASHHGTTAGGAASHHGGSRAPSHAGSPHGGTQAGSQHGGTHAGSLHGGTHAGTPSEAGGALLGDAPDDHQAHSHGHGHHSHAPSHHAPSHGAPSLAGSPAAHGAHLGDGSHSDKNVGFADGPGPDKPGSYAPQSEKAISHHGGTPAGEAATLGDAPQHNDAQSHKSAGEEISRLPTPGAEHPQDIPLSLQPGVSPMFGSPHHQNPDAAAPVAGGKGGKGKKGKKNSAGGGDVKSLGDAPDTSGGAADPVDMVHEAAADGNPGGPSEAPAKGPSPAGSARALGDAPQAPGSNAGEAPAKDSSPAGTARGLGDAPIDPALPEAAQKVDQVLSDATNGQHRRDPGIDAILDILTKAFPAQPPPQETAKDAPAGGMSDAERGSLEEKANNATRERDDAHGKLNEMLAVEKALSEERSKNAEKEKAELQQKVKDAEAERMKLEAQLGDVSKMRDEHHKLIADSLKQLTSFTTAEADRLKQASAKPSIQDLKEMMEHQNEENSKLLKVIASDIILHNTSQHRSTVGSIEKSNATAMKGNIDAAVDEFKKQLMPEVRGLVKEIGDLREQKRGLQHEISELFAIKSKQGNGAPPPPKVDYNPRAPPAKENKKDDKPAEAAAPPPPPAWLSWQPPVNFGPPPLPQPR